MKTFFSSLKPAFIATALLTLLLGILYPLFIYGIGHLFFRREAKGSLIFYESGAIAGSERIGQNFTKPEYFHPRPSSAGERGYDAANSAGSNLGPTSKELFDLLQQRVSLYRTENNLAPDVSIPADAVTASGSGLDPHISVANALLQAPRVAAARSVPLEEIQDLIEENKERPTLGLFGESRVNVLLLNLALEERLKDDFAPHIEKATKGHGV